MQHIVFFFVLLIKIQPYIFFYVIDLYHLKSHLFLYWKFYFLHPLSYHITLDALLQLNNQIWDLLAGKHLLTFLFLIYHFNYHIPLLLYYQMFYPKVLISLKLLQFYLHHCDQAQQIFNPNIFLNLNSLLQLSHLHISYIDFVYLLYYFLYVVINILTRLVQNQNFVFLIILHHFCFQIV